MKSIKRIALTAILVIVCIATGFALAGVAGRGPLGPQPEEASWKAKLARWLVWEALHDEFEQQPNRHSYQSLPPEHPQNQPIRYAAGPDGEAILDHSAGW